MHKSVPSGPFPIPPPEFLQTLPVQGTMNSEVCMLKVEKITFFLAAFIIFLSLKLKINFPEISKMSSKLLK